MLWLLLHGDARYWPEAQTLQPVHSVSSASIHPYLDPHGIEAYVWSEHLEHGLHTVSVTNPQRLVIKYPSETEHVLQLRQTGAVKLSHAETAYCPSGHIGRQKSKTTFEFSVQFFEMYIPGGTSVEQGAHV